MCVKAPIAWPTQSSIDRVYTKHESEASENQRHRPQSAAASRKGCCSSGYNIAVWTTLLSSKYEMTSHPNHSASGSTRPDNTCIIQQSIVPNERQEVHHCMRVFYICILRLHTSLSSNASTLSIPHLAKFIHSQLTVPRPSSPSA